MAEKDVAVGRLGSLLVKIREGLRQSQDTLRLALDQADSELLPEINVTQADINTAVLYLRDLGLQYDALRLHGGFGRCTSRCVREWLAVVADGESEEYRDWLTEKFGAFPVQVDPNDQTVFDRKIYFAGLIAHLSEFVDELIGTVNTMTSPPEYLTSWREIAIAVGLKDNCEDKAKVKALHKKSSDSPIIIPNQGAQPKVVKAKLLVWWWGLEKKFLESEQRQRSKQATLAAQHPFGRDGIAVPEIAGGVKKRRRDRKPTA